MRSPDACGTFFCSAKVKRVSVMELVSMAGPEEDILVVGESVLVSSSEHREESVRRTSSATKGPR